MDIKGNSFSLKPAIFRVRFPTLNVEIHYNDAIHELAVLIGEILMGSILS